MSNTSYHSKQIKENNQVTIQGGEKKVMKKILSVALSTAMAFSMFASVAFGDDAKLTSQQKFDVLKDAKILTGYQDGSAGLERDLTRAEFAKVVSSLMGLKPITGQLSFKDKGYTAKNWAVPYIEAVYSAGLMEGKNTTKMIFDYNGKITVQEMAAVLVRAMKLEVPAETDNAASAWAKGYVQAAVNAGIISKDAAPKANATRSQMVDTAYAIWLDQQQPKVVSYTVSENGKVVDFKLANEKVVKVTLETALEANKETEVKFSNEGYDYVEKVTWVVTTANKVSTVAADNLKEVVVTFDGEVDKASAELKDNYTLSNNLKVKSAVLSDAKNSVILTLDSAMTNQQKYTLSVANVKAGSKTISAKDIEFSPVDTKLPEVASVVSLGTKAVKIVFSEPVQSALTGSFQLDGKAFYGNPNIEDREVVLVPYDSSALSVGEHTLTVSGVTDYRNNKSLKSEHKFTVVEDKVAPTIAEATATLETLTVTFSEDVDPDTVKTDNVYHVQGSTKVKATGKKALAGNKYEFYFEGTGKNLPSYETTIHVEGVKDYSGNQITETTKLVKAGVDYERPFVIDMKVNDAKNQLTITFNKKILSTQDFTKLVTVTDKDGKIRQVQGGTVVDGNKLVVTFFSALPEGTNKVSVKGVKDNTLLQNVMLDYDTTVDVGDTNGPSVASASFNISSSERRVIIVFDEKMDPATLANRANYILTINGKTLATPDNAYLTVIQDSKGVLIDLPETIAGQKVFDGTSKLTNVQVVGVKDAAGNYLKDFSANVEASKYANIAVLDYNADKVGEQHGALTGSKEIKMKLNQAVSNVINPSSVTVSGNTVEGVTVTNSNELTIKLGTAIYTNDPAISVTFNNTKFTGTAGGEVVLGATGATYNVFEDKVAPTVAGDPSYYVANTVTTGVYAEIDFTENLKEGLDSYYAEDLIVTRLSDNKVLPVNTGSTSAPNYIVETVGKKITVKINDAGAAKDMFSIEIKSGAKYIQDLNGNFVEAKGALRTR